MIFSLLNIIWYDRFSILVTTFYTMEYQQITEDFAQFEAKLTAKMCIVGYTYANKARDLAQLEKNKRNMASIPKSTHFFVDCENAVCPICGGCHTCFSKKNKEIHDASHNEHTKHCSSDDSVYGMFSDWDMFDTDNDSIDFTTMIDVYNTNKPLETRIIVVSVPHYKRPYIVFFLVETKVVEYEEKLYTTFTVRTTLKYIRQYGCYRVHTLAETTDIIYSDFVNTIYKEFCTCGYIEDYLAQNDDDEKYVSHECYIHDDESDDDMSNPPHWSKILRMIHESELRFMSKNKEEEFDYDGFPVQREYKSEWAKWED